MTEPTPLRPLPPSEPQTITREELRAMYPPPRPMTEEEDAALRRLLAIARCDTGQSRRVADFLLAWWNAGDCGGFDLTNLWGVDTAISDDMATVFKLIARVHEYPEQYKEDFVRVVETWRPELVK
ncbi:hypothetical protein [Acidocella sp.]|uniref:DUF7673 family protein n=1 Tax=Acidocella sp. TaxID=50710 RepID=UPI00261046FC|nr:hypothetical protein [Acidocella sp.]MDD2794660.1 hypothetical protein [Acidocella sp.]